MTLLNTFVLTDWLTEKPLYYAHYTGMHIRRARSSILDWQADYIIVDDYQTDP